MKKIPTMFKREFENHKVVRTINEFEDPSFEDVLMNGVPTVKFDGSCCAVIDGKFYKRYDAKKGKPIPEGAIKCQEEADPVTGHLPCWVLVDENKPEDKWFVEAYNYRSSFYSTLPSDGTYEVIGPHFQGNPYNAEKDTLVRHGAICIEMLNRSFEGIKKFLEETNIEGIVFWDKAMTEPICKIKRVDFGFEWNGKNTKR